jgi:hypothetical protein
MTNVFGGKSRLTFSDMLDEYLELQKRGPDESSGYSDKLFYNRREFLRRGMDTLAPGDVEDDFTHER